MGLHFIGGFIGLGGTFLQVMFYFFRRNQILFKFPIGDIVEGSIHAS